MAGGQQPHYHLHAMDKGQEKDFKARVGAGWLNENGSISIQLNPFVKLEAHPNLVITLFPNNQAVQPANRPQPKGDLPDDDIPF